MIVLDTNVVSEAMKPEPDATVRAWLNEQTAETLYLSSVTLAELRFGIAVLPTGKRKSALIHSVDSLFGLFEAVYWGLSVISCSRHMMLPRRKYASQTQDPTGRSAGDSCRVA